MNVRNVLGVIIGITLVTTIATTSMLRYQTAYANATWDYSRKAPITSSGQNVYMAWWTNNTANGNNEVMFRSSTDGGQTFGDKINLSNTTNADSTRVEIDEEGDSVFVSWWETNQTADTPVARMSTDAGQTFGQHLMLASDGPIGGQVE
jgi:hypothetical protein